MKALPLAAGALIAHAFLAASAAPEADPFVSFADIPEPERLPRAASLSVAPDGSFLVNGRPRYLTATIFYGGTEERHIHTSGYPASLNWLYEEIPDFEGMQRLGVDAVGFEGGREWMNLVSPTAAPKWKMSGCFPAEPRFAEASAGQLPMYVDLTPAPWGHGGIAAKDNPQLPPEAWTAGDNHWVPYSIHHPEGRAIWMKMWRETAERYSKLPTKPYCYELMNEPAVYDDGPYAKALFAKTGRRNHPVEFLKFTDEAYASLIAEGVKAVHEVQPGALVTLQPLNSAGGARGIDLYRLSRICDLVCTPTGGGGISVAHMMRALADGKPIVDGETYIGTTESVARNALLCQFARGYNASYTFKWSRRPRDWVRGGNAAAEEPVAKGVAAYNFLNPYAVPTESLVGIRLAKRDALDVADFFVPRDRGVPRKVAVLYSKPTERICNVGRKTSIGLFAKVTEELEYSHLCPDVVFEEQLRDDPARLKRYKMLVAPGVSSVYPETPSAIRAWQSAGGKLVMVGERMASDEYGEPNGAQYPGAEFDEADGISASELGARLVAIAAKCGIRPTCENPGAERIEAIEARRGKASAWYLASRAVGPQVVRWRPAERAASAVSVRNVRRADGSVVSRRRKLLADAEGYFTFYLKHGDAELLVFADDAEIARRYPKSADSEWLPDLGADEAAAEAQRKLDEYRIARLAKKGGYHVDANRTRQLDLRRVANVRALDDKWWGMKEVEGVPFEFIRTDQNFFRDAVKLASAPAIVTVDDEVLHLYMNYSGSPAFTVEYADGARTSFRAPAGVGAARRVWRWTNPRPNVRVKRLAFAARGGEALVAAITAERPAPGMRVIAADEIADVKSRSGAAIAPELDGGMVKLIHGDRPTAWSCALMSFKQPIPLPPGKSRFVFEVNKLQNRYGKDAASPGLQVLVAVKAGGEQKKVRGKFATPLSDDGLTGFSTADNDPGSWETVSVEVNAGPGADSTITGVTFQYKPLPCADPAPLAVTGFRLEPVLVRQ